MPVVRISEELFKEIQQYAEPLVDDFESTLWKVLQLAKKRDMRIPTKNKARRIGNLTPPKDFWKPILETILENGEQSSAEQVIEGVERKMKNQLRPGDYERNRDGSYKWEKQVHFQRLAMKHEGLLAKDSPRGIWIITPQGRKWLSEQLSIRMNNTEVLEGRKPPL